MTLVTTARNAIRGGPRKVEPLNQWLLLDGSKLEPLGRFKYHDWYTHPAKEVRDFELEAQPNLINPDIDFIGNDVLVTVLVDGRPHYRVLTRHEAGTLERLKGDVPPEMVPKPQAVIDALIRYDLLTRTGAYWFRGCQTIIERLRWKGIEVRLTPDQLDIYATGAGGVAKDWALADMVENLTPLLLPFLRDGVAPPCRVTAHKQPVEATTIAPGGVVWCGTCQPEVSP